MLRSESYKEWERWSEINSLMDFHKIILASKLSSFRISPTSSFSALYD